MKTLTALLLVSLLALWIGFPTTDCTGIAFVIPRICPRNPFRCTVPGIDRCSSSYDCPGSQMCCSYNCVRICRLPQVRPRICPTIPFLCSSLRIRYCNNDYDCPRSQICCSSFYCGRVCRFPLGIMFD
ncbi:waprin-Enh1-like [Heteronotia binoei]|uniref:waprin-Enh1-like n=1 Tax=Heteronotia binoei TaxID=13085 RepID=UPI0029308972|nr:waprin-Enh1-like [Heteronotia binoei]